MSQDNTQNTQERGNTKTLSKQLRKVSFTLNNWTDEEIHKIVCIFEKIECLYIMGKEIAPTTGTPHIQGYIEFKKQKTWNAISKMLPRAHLEKTIGTREENLVYCMKSDKTPITNFKKLPIDRKQKLLEKWYRDTIWRKWQAELLDILSKPADSRTIHWFWEPNGNSGKSYLAKYLYLSRPCIIAEGKANDIFNGLLTHFEEFPDDVETELVIIVDVPRSSIGYLNYGALEKIKNGLIYSGKYEGGTCVFEHPHLIVFANEAPSQYEWSKDRIIEHEI